MDLQLKGKTALVTGGSEGIGKGIALILAKEGVDVAICARRKEPLEQAAAEIAKATNRKIVADRRRSHQGRRRQELRRAGPQGARPRRHHGQQCRLRAGRRDRASHRGGLGAVAAAQVHGLCALPALRAADHGQAGRRPRDQPDRQRRRQAVLLGDRAGRGQRRRPEPDQVARRPIRQAQHQLLRGQSRAGADRALGRPGGGDVARHEAAVRGGRQARAGVDPDWGGSPRSRRSRTSWSCWPRR